MLLHIWVNVKVGVKASPGLGFVSASGSRVEVNRTLSWGRFKPGIGSRMGSV